MMSLAVSQSVWSIVASWVEAVGTICAIIGAAWIAAGESRATRRRENSLREEGRAKEARAELATKTAALNMAILAATQIHDLHVSLRDEAWRGRVTRVSPSRTLLATENMLVAFPVQSLGDAPAMVEFCRFPSALATAAEVYANLEAAVRLAPEPERAAIFDEYAKMMARIDAAAGLSLTELRESLRLTASSGELEKSADGKSQKTASAWYSPLLDQ